MSETTQCYLRKQLVELSESAGLAFAMFQPLGTALISIP
jgi:hypothetical protein